MAVDRCQDYLDALEEERRKILVFQRELPLSMQLISQAIDSYRQQMVVENSGGPSESDETSTGGLIFEEFIPIRRDLDKTISGGNCEEDADRSHLCQHDKPDWLKSVQLWNQEVETSPKEYHHPSPSRTKNTSDPALSAAATADPPAAEAYQSSRNKKDAETKGCQPQRKSRRCWSPELHRRFLHALQELGGSHATPKQIRELMKVDDLTNDEVKSHLQKHRLHTRRLPGQPAPGPNPQPAQFVVVSGIWVASDYTAMASSAQASEAAATAIFTPLTTTCMSPPAIPVNKQPQHRSPAGLSRGADSSSSATSSHITCFPAV